ncbi:hypothetical protein K505DRAFT_340423 [Melanomma pulvis-pyrius CBS 109.77]|uniref:Uncharacterized protein n=1 Tax=Melanomma pulvis-pyrius CBS 109.77 TaxID=1314802 RepID=A0A6A6X278_9PLEO|nr:hypothetical protein K505DRAFT_340423 [Melanomma pulvis-pyrius CBS 109.77]
MPLFTKAKTIEIYNASGKVPRSLTYQSLIEICAARSRRTMHYRTMRVETINQEQDKTTVEDTSKETLTNNIFSQTKGSIPHLEEESDQTLQEEEAKGPKFTTFLMRSRRGDVQTDSISPEHTARKLEAQALKSIEDGFRDAYTLYTTATSLWPNSKGLVSPPGHGTMPQDRGVFAFSGLVRFACQRCAWYS